MPEERVRPVEDAASFAEFMEASRSLVDAELDRVLPPAAEPPADLHRAMRHSVFAGGKRVRPLLALGAARACGAAVATALPAAVAVELIHTYSLIHDDLPSFDDEQLRRGQPTSHVLFGDAVAILAGDALQALAFEHLAGASAHAEDPRRGLEALRLIGAAAGSIGMCGGQTFDIQAAGQDLDLDALRRLHRAKTGALLTASVSSGAVLAGADGARRAALNRYGNALGLAFQVVDDLLDVEGDAAALGKNPGGDADRDQPTFASLLGVDGARREALSLREEAHEALAPFGPDGAMLAALADFVVERSR